MTDLMIPSQAPLIPEADARKRLSKEDISFIPTLKLLHGVSAGIGDEVKTPTGITTKNIAGSFFLQQKGVNFGDRCLIHIVHRRSHAILFVKQSKEEESFDPESPIFEKIERTVEPKDRSVTALYGHDWLVWLPAVNEFGTFFPGRNTQRPVSEDIFDYITPTNEKREAAKDLPETRTLTLFSKMISKGPTFKTYISCVEPGNPENCQIPTQAELDVVMKKFLDPVMNETKVEEVTDSEETDR